MPSFPTICCCLAYFFSPFLIKFMSYFHHISKHIEAEGFWCDAVDPCSGILVYFFLFLPSFPLFPHLHLQINSPRGGGIFSDLDFISSLVPYTFQQAGGCAVLVHPSWGSAVYPSIFFTTSPPPFLVPLLSNPQHLLGNKGT